MIITTPHGDLSVEGRGSGPPVLLAHSLAMSAEMWWPAADKLTGEFRVWAMDARGHGRSSFDGAAFTVEDMAGDVIAVLDALDVPAAHVVGLSMGGSTAIALAARYPERVDRLVLADTTACYGPEREQRWEERARTAASVSRERQLDFQLERWFTPGFRAARPDEVRRLADVFVRTSPAAHAEACRALGRFDAEERLPGIRADTLVIVGAEDYATPPSMARVLAERIPRARMREVPGTRHMSLLERPELWDEIAAHLRGGALA